MSLSHYIEETTTRKGYGSCRHTYRYQTRPLDLFPELCLCVLGPPLLSLIKQAKSGMFTVYRYRTYLALVHDFYID